MQLLFFSYVVLRIFAAAFFSWFHLPDDLCSRASLLPPVCWVPCSRIPVGSPLKTWPWPQPCSTWTESIWREDLKSESGAIRIDPWRLIATSDRCKIKWSNSSDKTSCHLLPSDLSESRNKLFIKYILEPWLEQIKFGELEKLF